MVLLIEFRLNILLGNYLVLCQLLNALRYHHHRFLTPFQ